MTETATAATSVSNDTAAPPKATGSAGRLCSACNETKAREAYSGKQWELNAKTRRCTHCVTNDVKSPAAAVAAAKPAVAEPKATTTTTTNITAKASDSDKYGAELRAKLKAKLPKAARQAVGSRPALLDEGGDWFLPPVEAALSEIFRRFDHDNDGAWNIADSQKFAVATNGKSFTTEELNEILQHFERGESGGWTLKGFLQFYHLQSSSHVSHHSHRQPDETWKDLQKLGYSWDFELTEKGKKLAAAAAEVNEAQRKAPKTK